MSRGGCKNCGNIGYKGRIAIYELLEVTPQMRRLKLHDITPEKIRDLAFDAGFRTLRQSAIEKLLAGVTSLEEVLSVT